MIARLWFATCLAISLIGAAALGPAQARKPAECQDATLASGAKVRMCKDAGGNWVQQSAASTAPSATGFPHRAEVIWQGTFDITVSEPGRVKSVSLGGLLNAATSGKSQRYTGRIEFRSTITGDQAITKLSGTNFETSELLGTVRAGFCRFEIHNGKYDIVYEGRCDAKGFDGQVSGTTARGLKQKGTFTTRALSVVDLDERDRQQAAARAEQQRQAAAAKEERRKAAASELPGLWAQFENARRQVKADADQFSKLIQANRSKSEVCPFASPHENSTRNMEAIFSKIRAYRQEFPEIDRGSDERFRNAEGWVNANRNLVNVQNEMCYGWR